MASVTETLERWDARKATRAGLMKSRIVALTDLGDGLVMSGWNPDPSGGGSFTISRGGDTVGVARGATATEAGENVTRIVQAVVAKQQEAEAAAAAAAASLQEDVDAAKKAAIAAYKAAKTRPAAKAATTEGED